RLVTLEREIKPAKMDENYTLMAKTKDRWQNLKVFEFQRKKTAGRMPVTTASATGRPVMKHDIFMNGRINARLCGKPYWQSATP
ncbi:MAG: hypothetical protein KIC78_08400, partial [Prevotella sp.]|uniref:hypothetical protein n=1 Tax=Prevotella sp. TaxID=59823 RepID=UPI00257D3029